MDIGEIEKILLLLRSIGEEEKKVAFALLQGMETQRFLDEQSEPYAANQ